MSLANYTIREIEYSTAMDLVIKNHYLHRKAPCSKAFGLFDEKKEICGVVIYGISASSTLLKGICGPDEAGNVYELTRLWIDDKVPKNGESFLIGNTLKKLDKEIIVSYADTSANHIGLVYQATNFLYTGLSAAHVEYRLAGAIEKHSRHLFDEYGGINAAKLVLGDQLIKIQRARKHRYIFINAKGRRRRELLQKLRYKILTYPKK